MLHPKLAVTVVLMALTLPVTRPVGAQSPTVPPAPPTIAPGEHVPEFDTITLDGTARHVDYPKGKATVLLFFMSSCHVCHGMIPEWNRAYERRTSDVEILGVMVDDAPPAYLQQLNIEFPIVHAPKDFGQTFKVQRVPQTIRVAPGGRVEDIAVGHIDAMRLGELVRPPQRATSAKSR